MADKGDMKSWEFLLQKEGDRTWLPLENTTVEILEGRYRVVARTPCPQGNVDIYVSFISSEDDPPKRRIQQRSHTANDDGLLAILPFTPFRPGRWELRCRPHVEAGDVAQQWHSQIQLQVLCQEGSGDEDLFGWDRPQDDLPPPELADSQITVGPQTPNGQPPTGLEEADSGTTGIDSLDPAAINPAAAVSPEETAASEAALARSSTGANVTVPPTAGANSLSSPSASALDPATASDADIQRLAEEMSQMVVDSVINAGGTPGTAIAPPVPSPSASTESQPTPTDPLATHTATKAAEWLPGEAAIDLVLDDTVLVMDGDRQITLSGQVVFPNSTWGSSGPTAPSPPELVLTLELRDPSTKEIWTSHRDSFRPSSTPQDFATPLQVPSACLAQLLIGRATLWSVGGGGVGDSGTPEQLLSQDFSVMAAVEALLDFARQPRSTAEIPLDGGTVESLQQQAASNFLLTKFGAPPQTAKGSTQINTELLNLLKPAGDDGASSSRASKAVPVIVESNRPRIELPKFGNAPPVSLSQPAEAYGDIEQPDFEDFPLGEEAEVSSHLSDALGHGLAVEPRSSSTLPSDLEELLALENNALDPIVPPSANPSSAELSPATAMGAANLVLDDENPFALPADDSLTELDNRLGNLHPDQDDITGYDAAYTLASLTDNLGSAGTMDASLTPGDPGSSLAIAEPGAMAPLSSQDSFAHEVVVDDEETIPPQKLAWMQAGQEASPVDTDILVPMPDLTVPDGVLVRGETVRIQVRVAQEPARLCARVWLLDCQSRTLMGEPQWITAFLPLGQDWMEANVDLIIPEGSIELQVEAIAVEPTTQRESRKISARRKVTLTTEPDTRAPF